jgi:putative ABC transport system permease protein
VIAETVLLALRQVRTNPLRSLLTTLGIVVGVASVIVIVTLGAGARQAVALEVAKLGRNTIFVFPTFRSWGGPGAPAPGFRADDLQAIARVVPGVAEVAGVGQRRVMLVRGAEHHTMQVQGVTQSWFRIRPQELSAGRLFTDAEQAGGLAVCIIGERPRRELFGSLSPIGQRVRIGSLPCEVVGLLAAQGSDSFGNDQDNVLLMPLLALQQRLAGSPWIGSIAVTAVDEAESDRVADDVEALLRERRRVPQRADSDFGVEQSRQVADLATRLTTTLTAVLGAIAGISLLVGDLRIMNIMLVSVTERTREIGIRLAIGALERDVLGQFLVEAVTLSLLGGGLGIALGLGAAAAIAPAIDLPFIVDARVVAGAVAFSAAVGVAFGYLPARRASRLNPIDALRHE